MELAYSIGSWMSAGGVAVFSLWFIFLFTIDEFFLSLDSLGETFRVVIATSIAILFLIMCMGIGTLGLTGLVDLCM